MKRLALVFALLFAAIPARAADLAPWHIVPEQSSLSFAAKGSDMAAPITGGFAKFGGTILFDPARLAESKISIDVDVTSFTASLSEAKKQLPTAQWFDLATFPKAHYETTAIAKRPDGSYEAQGTLTLKGVTAPVTLTFSLPSFDAKKAVAKGTARLSRGAFKVGQGDLVDDPVDLAFTITADHP